METVYFLAFPKVRELCFRTLKLRSDLGIFSLSFALSPTPFFKNYFPAPLPVATWCRVLRHILEPPHLCAEITWWTGGFILVCRTNPKKLFFCSTLGHHTLGRLLIPASLGLADAPCFLPSTPTMATLRLP